MVNKSIRLLSASFVVLLLLIAPLTAAMPPVPVEITYQGQLEEGGLPVDGVRSFLFTITDEKGLETSIWNSGVQSVSISSGIFKYIVAPLNSVDWANPPSGGFYLEVKMGPSTAKLEDELLLMGPRSKINTHLYEKYYKGKNGSKEYRVYYTAPSITHSKGVISNSEKKVVITYKYARVNNYWDILDTSKKWRAKARDILMQFVEEAGLKKYFIDCGIGGSLAYGIARLPGKDEDDPSDLDCVVYLDLDDERCQSMSAITKDYSKAKYEQILREELAPGIKVSIILSSNEKNRVKDPNFILYSLTHDRMYGRDDGEKKYVKMYQYNSKVIYLFNRAEYVHVLEGDGFEKKVFDDLKYDQKVSSDNVLIFYDKGTGKEVLRSN